VLTEQAYGELQRQRKYKETTDKQSQDKSKAGIKREEENESNNCN
jgi:hypothetical protein